jgi:anti-sigma regulatory factor (Ser/Thr protein kinase)
MTIRLLAAPPTTDGSRQEPVTHVAAELAGLTAPQRTARELIRALLSDVSDAEWVHDIVLAADELVGNAQQHSAAAAPMAITIDRYPWGLTVQVTDSGRPVPLQPKVPETEGCGGRGLFLVNALATAWDVRPGGHGKIVRAVFAHREAR